ncbi:ROBO2 protein, partial [Acromyrmex charruanus]
MCVCVCVTGVQAATNRDGHPTTVQTYENETVLLPCYVEDAQTRVRWWRDEILLAESSFGQEQQSSERITLYSNGSLRVHHVQREDSGPYVCQAIRPSPWGHVTQVHEIEVMYPSSVETVPERGELEVDLNEEVIMQCVAKGVPAPIISWRTKGREIPFRDTRAVLRFSADNRNLSGRYTCVANNEIGEPAEAHIDLRVRSVDSSENSEMDDDQEQNRIAVIQLSSMSQHYLLTTDASGSIYNQSQVLSLILSTLCTLIITRDRFN